MADISAIELPDGVTYDIKDKTSGYITGMTILSYGSSTWQNFIDAYNTNRVVYCRASSNANPASGSQTRLAFMAYVNNATTPTEVEFQYYRSVSSHSDSQQGDQVYVYKLNKTNGWSVTVREADSKIAVSTGLSKSYSSGTITLSLDTTRTASSNQNGLMSSTDYTKLDGIASGAEVNVQADWSESDSTSDAYILNKPTITDTTYTMSIDSNILTLTPSIGTAQTITLPDNNTTYSLSQSSGTITLSGSDSSSDSITLTASDIGAVPTSRTVNGHALSANVTIGTSDIGITKKTQISGTFKASAANAWEYTGTSITVPSNHVYLVRAQLGYSSGRPIGVGFNTSTTIGTSGYPNPYFANSDGINTAPVFMLYTGTHYLFEKRATTPSSNNTHWVDIVDIAL